MKLPLPPKPKSIYEWMAILCFISMLAREWRTTANVASLLWP